ADPRRSFAAAPGRGRPHPRGLRGWLPRRDLPGGDPRNSRWPASRGPRPRHDRAAGPRADHPAAGGGAHAAARREHLHLLGQGFVARVGDLGGGADVGVPVARRIHDAPGRGADRHRLPVRGPDLSLVAAGRHPAQALSGGVGVSYEWHWEVLWQSLPMLLEGVRITVLASLITMIAALVLGLMVALARIAGGPLGALAYVYVEFFRNSPQLMVVVWVFTVLPLVTGITLSPLLSGIVALTLNVSAFVAEVYRAGITSISAGQTQAALALGMTRIQLYRRVLLPQAVARV